MICSAANSLILEVGTYILYLIARPDTAKTASKSAGFLAESIAASPHHHAAADQAISYPSGTM